jgi:MoaA/NifB/PqqE/SkfB family radical SAM enzyme
MALQVITPMLKSPKVLHLEVTDVCQAACPQCEREVNPAFDNTVKHHLSVEQIKSLFNEDFIQNLDKMFMCGNYGDPAAGKHTLDIFRYFKQINPNITLGMNTNGAINNAQWWQELASVLNGTFDYVVFSIDGLEDTNHIYRKNVVWAKLVENARAYINAGGSAQWEMLIYKHNEHQIELAEQTARDLGFNWFRTKVSKRFKDVPIIFLNPPTNYQLPNVAQAEKIECYAITEQSIYVAATGRILPCCWFGSEVFSLDGYANQLLTDWELLKASWSNDPHSICSNTCGMDKKGNSFTNQWQIQKQLK